MSPATKEAISKAVRTFVIATAGLAIPGLLGWLNDLTSWARSNGTTPLPDAHGLLFIVVAAIAAGFIAVLNFFWIIVENATGKGMLRTPPPNAQHKDQDGVASWLALVLVVVVIALVLYLVL